MARKLTSQRVLAGVLLLIVAGIGCNPLMLPMYLFRDMRQSRIPSHFDFYEKAHTAKKKKDIKVVVLTEPGRGLSPVFISQEKTLTTMIVNQLQSNFLQNKERVKIVPVGDVEKFKRQHVDDWKAMDAREIAKHFEADYLIDIELRTMSLYEQGTQELFRGHCRLPIRIVDVDENAPELFAPHDYECDYPGGGEAVPVGFDMSSERFAQKFFARIAIDVAGLFSATETSQKFRQR
jgi:hypothetical protein